MEILTGIDTGEKQADGTYPEHTINGMVKRRLENMAKRLAHFAKDDEDRGELKVTNRFVLNAFLFRWTNHPIV
jgi:hypothetical protein